VRAGPSRRVAVRVINVAPLMRGRCPSPIVRPVARVRVQQRVRGMRSGASGAQELRFSAVLLRSPRAGRSRLIESKRAGEDSGIRRQVVVEGR